MEHVYTAYTKLVQGKKHYFVKKMMTLPEIKGMGDIQVGFGMHTDFEKACHIAGITDEIQREKLLMQLERQNRGTAIEKKVADPVTRLLADLGVEVMN